MYNNDCIAIMIPITFNYAMAAASAIFVAILMPITIEYATAISIIIAIKIT